MTALSGCRVSNLACGWRHCLAVTQSGDFYSWGRGVNGQLGHSEELDVLAPQKLEALSAGSLTAAGIIATATAPSSGFAAAADRYAVVPDGDGGDINGGSVVPDIEPSAKKQRMEVPA